MLKIKNLRTRHLSYYIVIDTKRIFIGFIWVKEELKYTPFRAQIVMKILTPFNKTTVNISWAPQASQAWGKMNSSQIRSVLAHALTMFSCNSTYTAFPESSPVGSEPKSLAIVP